MVIIIIIANNNNNYVKDDFSSKGQTLKFDISPDPKFAKFNFRVSA